MLKKSLTNWNKMYEYLPADNLSPNERLKGTTTPSQPGVPKVDDTYTPKYSGNSYTPSYTGSDFNGWYKYHYGSDYDGSSFTRASGMSDLDWEQGNNLYNYYNSEKFQKNQYEQSKSDAENRYGYQYDNAQRNRDFTTSEAERRANSSLSALERYYLLSGETLDKSKTQSQQQASVMYDKLKKYLPVQVKAQGLGGLGVSESTLLDAYNKYSSAMGSIESDYQKNKSSLDNNYQDNKRSIESDRDSAINAANNAYDNTVANIGLEKEQTLSDLQRNYDQFLYDSQEKARSSNQGIIDKHRELYEKDEAEKKQTEKEDRNSALESARDIFYLYIEDMDYNGAKAYLEANKDTFGEKEYLSRLAYIENKISQENKGGDGQQGAEDDEKVQRIMSGKEALETESGFYLLTSQLNSESNEIAKNVDFTDKLKEAGYLWAYDPKIPNGTTFEIECYRDGANRGYNSAAGSRCVTYYNGNWYVSKKL